MKTENLLSLLKSKTLIYFIVIAIVVSWVALQAYYKYGESTIGIDDANISFVYAKNFAEGHGFVYNIGGEKVEGFTSMLWVLISSFFFKFSPKPEFSILIFNILILSIALTLTVKFISKLEGSLNKFLSLVFLMWVLAVPSFTVWSVLSLMEVGLYSVLLLSTLLLVLDFIKADKFNLRKVGIFSFVLALMVLARPESLLWSPFFVACFALAQFVKTKNILKTIKYSLLPALTTIGTIAALTAFRLYYFGYLLPNTYYAKVSHDKEYNREEGDFYFNSFINSNGLVKLGLVLAVLALIFVIRRLIKRKSIYPTKIELMSFIVALSLVIGFYVPVYNGGDHFNQFRFYQPIWPLIILNAIIFFKLISENYTLKKIGFEYSALVLVLFGYAFYTSDAIEWNNIDRVKGLTIAHEFAISEWDRVLGIETNGFFEDYRLPNVGVITAGSFKITYQGEVTDLLGLNNTKMAHSNSERIGVKNHAAFSKDVFYELEPEVLLLELKSTDEAIINAPSKPGGFWHAALKGILTDEEFLELYTPATLTNIRTSKYMFGFYRNDFLEGLRENGNYEINIASFD